MDDLIEELDAMDWGEHPAVGKAATALRAYAEREKELVEALQWYVDEDETNEGNENAYWLARRNRARAILSKLKE